MNQVVRSDDTGMCCPVHGKRKLEIPVNIYLGCECSDMPVVRVCIQPISHVPIRNLMPVDNERSCSFIVRTSPRRCSLGFFHVKYKNAIGAKIDIS